MRPEEIEQLASVLWRNLKTSVSVGVWATRDAAPDTRLKGHTKNINKQKAERRD